MGLPLHFFHLDGKTTGKSINFTSLFEINGFPTANPVEYEDFTQIN